MIARPLLALALLAALAGCTPPPAALTSAAAPEASPPQPVSPRARIVQRAVDEARQTGTEARHLLEISRIAAEEIVDSRPSAPRAPASAPRTAAERAAAEKWELAVLTEQRAVLTEMRARLERQDRLARQTRYCEDLALDTAGGALSVRRVFTSCMAGFRRTDEFLGR